ncbi:Mov34/MPN/PAD-1 family protein [Methylobacterium sp. E-045]|uniref:Mov34/MPN/PAD-1 family protein n=1 Tax=Methylobacterium sp. E-045 TaxID=2836575 RepID=UPI001FBA5498|nr:Mov34/MPN/PAD-1 family protein [Methylobacterium sp. E-045]MCJ2128603.1 Mov34/MPN/PAD-1 family protein [Methylobacterium sp. E-045]
MLTFSAGAVAKFSCHRQTRWYHREAGGQLFARFSGNEVVVEVATGPRWRDRRTRHSYEPHRPSEQREIDRHHRRGFHFVGDWHTHAEERPRPSALDLESMAESFARSSHRLNAFVMVIVGTEPPPDGMIVFACNATAAYELSV